MSRVSDTFIGWYREPGDSAWNVLGWATTPFSETVLVGLAVYNQGNLFPVSAEFDRFYVSQVVPPILATPCGTTNQTQPTIYGLATADTQVNLYTDGTPVATTTASVEGIFAVSPTIPLSPGPHILTATVTSADKESPPSPNLNLTVAPDEAIDLVGITIAHAPLFGDGPPVVDHLRNSAGCASCDGTGFNAWIPGGKPITVSVPVSATGVTSVTVHISATDYILSDPDGDRIYQGTFTPPSVRGVASLEFVVHRAGGLVIEYTCGEIIIDPYGTVYDAAVGPSAPIAGATVRLYYQNPDTLSWSVWSPTGGQDNPQTTGSDVSR